MGTISTILIYALIGIGLVTIIDVGGSILSRKLNFNYGYFTILSFTVYTSIAYLVMRKTNLAFPTLLCVYLIALYDGYFGWKISRKLNANYGKNAAEIIEKIKPAYAILASTLFAIVCGVTGVFLGKN